MSQTESELEKYRGSAGSEVKTADMSSDEHALKNAIGDDDSDKERIYDAKLAGERFVQFYDDTAAAIREYLSNAETACIRRAKQELLDAGFSEDEIPQEVSELLVMAKEEAGYEPLIEVTYNRKADETRLIIEDNGIGISTEEYQVVQRVGYSTSHDHGERLGNFGMGWMSGFQLTSVNGVFKMMTRSYLTDEAYGTAEYVANFEYLDVEPDEYGTRFEFPSFGEEAKDINIPSKVEEFVDGMVISVLYRDFDESGNETSMSDDFLPTRMEDDYDDTDVVITYENEFFKAVMSPSNPNNRRSPLTYNISMPIRRNCDEWGSEPVFEAAWEWDYRGKREDGPIVECPSDDSLVGKIPKEDSKYERLMDDLQQKCVPLSDVPDDAIVMPEPASSRDSFKSGHDDFWRYVSECLNDEWADIASTHFEGIDTWQDFLDMDREGKQKLFRAYKHFGPNYGKNEPDNIQETLEENLGVTVPTNVCEKIDRSQKTVNVVSRGSNRAHTKGATHSKRIWKVIDDAPDGVYMGKTISQKKAEIAWGLGETDVVRLDSGDSYAELSSDWGWDKLKNLPSRNLEEKLPNLDQDIIDKYENKSATDSNNTKSTGGNGRNPSTYRLKVRWSTGSRKYYTVHSADTLKETLEDGDTFKAGYKEMEYLVIRPDSDSARSVAGHANTSNKVGATRLPKYVYKYFEDVDNVYESYSEVVEDKRRGSVTFDGTEHDMDSLSSDQLFIFTESRFHDQFEDRPDELAEYYGYDTDDYSEIRWIDADDVEAAWKPESDADFVAPYRATTPNDFTDYIQSRKEFTDVYETDVLGDVDTSSDEYEALFGYRRGHPSDTEHKTLVEIAEQVDLPTTDDS